jgi:hypothetical protein
MQNANPYPEQLFYWTTDGNWKVRRIDLGRSVSEFTGYGNTLYALLASPSDGSSAKYALAQSTDGGSAWKRTTLPIAFSPPSTTVAWTVTKASATFAVNGQGLLVVANSQFQAQPVVDALQSLQGAEPHVGFSAQIDDDGVDITRCYAPNPRDTCTPKTVRHFSWLALGVLSPHALDEQGVWFSSDTKRWRRVESGLDAWSDWGRSIVEGQSLVALRDRFVMVTQPYHSPTAEGDDTPTYYELVDGVWRRTPYGQASFIAFGDATSRLVMMIDGPHPLPCTPGACTVLTSTDAGYTWHSTAVERVVPDATGISPLSRPLGGGVGFTAAVATLQGHTTGSALIASRDGVHWTVVSAVTAGVDYWNGSDDAVHSGDDRLWVSFRDSRDGFANKAVVGTVVR